MQADEPVAIPIVEEQFRHFQSSPRADKQLAGVRLQAVLEKRALDQALNAKEFAMLAGISYSTARQWLRISGFPILRGHVFWKDFVKWRQIHVGLEGQEKGLALEQCPQGPSTKNTPLPSGLPKRSARILSGSS